MAKPKASTLQQRLGFSDPDLKKPAHDDIMDWLDNALDNYPDLLLGNSNQWDVEKISFVNTSDAQKKFFQSNPVSNWHYFDFWEDPEKEVCLPERPPSITIQKVWEEQVIQKGYNHNNFVIGFVDMAAICEVPSLSFNAETFEFDIKYYPRRFLFEVKTEIKSMGELIRQIRLYQTYTQGNWRVVAPKHKYQDKLIQQGIGFIEYQHDRFIEDEAELPDGTTIKIPIS